MGFSGYTVLTIGLETSLVGYACELKLIPVRLCSYDGNSALPVFLVNFSESAS